MLSSAFVKRWYVLILFVLMSCFQCVTWFTFSTVPNVSMQYYGFGESTLNLLLNLGTIMFFPSVFIISPIIPHKKGLYYLYRNAQICLYISQILNGLMGPTVLASPSALSRIWFPEKQRALATAIAVFANGTIGMGISFLIGPLVADNVSHFPHWLIMLLAITGLIALLVMIYYPAAPDTPPSEAARIKNEIIEEEISVKKYLKNFAIETLQVLKNYSAVMVLIASGFQTGTCMAWGGLLPQVLALQNGNRDYALMGSLEAGWVGFCLQIGNVFGSLFSSKVISYVRVRAYHIAAMILFLGASLFYFVFFIILVPPFTSPFGTQTEIIENSEDSTALYVLKSDSVLIVTIFIVFFCGAMQGFINPISYEWAAELTFPCSEGTSGGLISLIACSVCSVWLAFISEVPIDVIVIGMFSISFCLAFLVFFARGKNKRYEAETTKVFEGEEEFLLEK